MPKLDKAISLPASSTVEWEEKRKRKDELIYYPGHSLAFAKE